MLFKKERKATTQWHAALFFALCDHDHWANQYWIVIAHDDEWSQAERTEKVKFNLVFIDHTDVLSRVLKSKAQKEWKRQEKNESITAL